jgi:diguanylate cyclase (GGDEF)-like protein
MPRFQPRWPPVTSHWLDLSDESRVRHRRARLTAWFTLSSCLSNVTLPFGGIPGIPPQPWAIPVILVQAAITGLLFRRGTRVLDGQFVAIQLAVAATTTPLLIMSVARGSLRSAELVLLVPLLLAVVFCTTRLQAGLVVLACISGAALVTRHRIVDTVDTVAQAVGQLIVFMLLAAIVRSLRDSAHDALIVAKKGEITDPLTGLPNRRGFERLGSHTWGRRAQDRQHVAVLLLDIDHFKQVNDTMGHAAGDEVLRRFAEVLVENSRSSDLVVRLGGEEFAVLCPTEPGEGIVIAERLRACVERDLAPVTVSIGVEESVPTPSAAETDPSSALWNAVAVADSQLYRAKRDGRNRVVAHHA